MKKNIFKVLLAGLILFFVGYNIYSSQKKPVISSLISANIEALAIGEWESADNNWYQECSKCYTVYGNTGAFFFCNVGFDNCFNSDCVAGYCF